MIKITNPADCCGCTACAAICGHDAISMKPDDLGFLYPFVDTQKCVDCGLCEKVCAFNDAYYCSANYDKPTAYGVRHKDTAEIMRSRSGAAFVAISDYILDRGGIVYGAGYTDHFRVVHKRATTKEERDEFRGSKYVQSDLTGVFRNLRKDLANGKEVLFSGTPCQTAGLISFVGEKLRKNLLVVDIVCHGVPSPYIWRDYLSSVEQKNGENAIMVNFRDKQKFGWAAHAESVTFQNKTVYSSAYTYLFSKDIMLRHSCGKCHFTNTKRASDITIADFWGWQNNNATFNADDKGCNLVLINTEKGKNILNAVAQSLDCLSVKLENCMQPNLEHPSVICPERMMFERDYIKHGFRYVNRKYGKPQGIRRIIIILRRKARTAIRIIFKI